MGKSKVIRCSRYENVVRMYVRLDGKPLAKVDCLSICGCKSWQGEDMDVLLRINEGLKAWGGLSNCGLGKNEKKGLFEGVIVKALYDTQTWGIRTAER